MAITGQGERICKKCGSPKPGKRCGKCRSAYLKTWAKTPAGIAYTQRTYAQRLSRPRVTVSTIVCCRCGIEKAATSENFYRNLAMPTGWAPDCKACRSKVAKHYKRANRYGISREEYDELLRLHPVCAICKLPFADEKPHLDHCHKTGGVRGLLCFNCNTMLGKAGDNVAIFQSAIQYLKSRAA